MEIVIVLLVGMAVGAVAAWLLAAAGHRAALAEALRHSETERATTESELGTARRERDAEVARTRQAQTKADEATARTDAAVAAAATARAELASATAQLHAERAAAGDREQLLARREAELKDSFQALSAEALARNNEAFVQLAEAKLAQTTAALSAKADGEATRRQQAVQTMIGPVTETLTRIDGQLRSVEKDRQAAYTGLVEQVGAMHRSSQQLQSETRQLVNALRAPQVRGRWGELQLERIVQLAGMVEHCDFEQQVTGTDSGGDEDSVIRPDMIVRLAGDKQIVVDAKVPFGAYLEAVDTDDPDVHTKRLAAHARHLRAHVDSLSSKAYWAAFEPSPEFVVLFVPGDAFLEAALRADVTVQEYAFERNVVIATPTTLIALLRTVAYTWRQEALARNARKVHELGRELHSRLSTMGGHVSRMGRQLDGVVNAYNQTVSSLESRVLVTARRFSELELVDKDLEAPEQVERNPREVQAPELVASADASLVALEAAREAVAESRDADGTRRVRGRQRVRRSEASESTAEQQGTDDTAPDDERQPELDWGWAAELNRRRGEDPGRSTVNG